MFAKLYYALIEATPNEPKAREASEEIADAYKMLIDTKVDMAGMRADMTVIKWMFSLIVGALVAILIKVYIP